MVEASASRDAEWGLASYMNSNSHCAVHILNVHIFVKGRNVPASS